MSVLSLGDGGWVQAGNFIASGVLIGGFGIGLGRVRAADQGRLGPRLLVLAGAGLAVCGLFSTDPQWGYPAWISAEAAANPSWHSRLHYLGGFVAAAALPLAIVVEGRLALLAGRRSAATYALASAVVMGGCFLAGVLIGGPGAAFAWGGVLQRGAIVAGLQWLAVIAIGAFRATGALGTPVRDRPRSPSSAAWRW